MQHEGFCFVISKFKQLHSLHEFPCFLIHLHSYMEHIIKGHGLLSLCLHIVTNDVQCNTCTYLFDPYRHIRIFCALEGTEKCIIYCLSQDPFPNVRSRKYVLFFNFVCLFCFYE